MSAQRVTQEDLVVVDINANASIRVTQEDLNVVDINANANARVTQEDLNVVDINANAQARVTEIVYLAISPHLGFRELFSPLTGF